MLLILQWWWDPEGEVEVAGEEEVGVLLLFLVLAVLEVKVALPRQEEAKHLNQVKSFPFCYAAIGK